MTPYPIIALFVLTAGFSILTACESTSSTVGTDDGLAVGEVLEEDEGDKLICKRQRVVGSHVPKTVCKTESQLAAEREAMDRAVGTRRPMTGYNSQRDPGSDPPR